ncbi:molybdopterin-dependent oxidoreductase [Cypionkella sp.]|uniref:molybdopterin-dependent oxidoreductase n=1 Tax=Cypionkella sp. TaxID=2811411 RepID=UPI002ABC7C20|nr:molybdopterin-dependent oxidoreductase [Cypionkella sp.]MDZ4392125.1 molybdopterin-dependent oxidoreductase [Cypionkella sp.]
MTVQPRAVEAGHILTTCPYCGVGCGILAKADGKGGLIVKGDPDHPANKGRLCSKGSALGETVGLEGRLLAPRVFGQEVAWDDALGVVAKRFSRVIADHGPDAVAFYVSGQLLTEDYYVANKLMKGFIGSANIDTNSRLCMASSVAGHKRAFGSDTVPGLYEDLELADLVVLTGSNLAWCHPVLYQRIASAKAARPEMKIVVIDPRRTATCDIADLHLAIAPGADAALFNALLVAIADAGAVDLGYLSNVVGYAEALTAACVSDPATTGLPAADLAEFLRLWTSTEKVVTVYSQGINQSSSGSDKVNAILNCHLATGRIGRPGMGPFSVTGQPNAMGGREVGGLANMLACHLDLENQAHRDAVQGFWASPTMAQKPGLKAVDMFRGVADGTIKAIWIIHTNPAVTMPDADAVAAAVKACPFVVVSDITAETDTARLAHVLLPATAWGEKDGSVTNSDRTISRQRSILPRPGKARPDWWILAQVARRMGHGQAFAWETEAEIFAEYAALSGIAGALGGDFDISDLASLSGADYDALAPFTWPQNPRQRGGRFFGTGRFHTPDARARMLPITPRAPQLLTLEHPFRLNTGRIRDQWHTMTRSGKSPRLSQHLAEPFVEIHPADATSLNIRPDDLVVLSNGHGRCILRALISQNAPPGQVFAPMHWTAENASAARIDTLVPGIVDPISGQPESKAAAVAAALYPAQWFGFAVSATPLQPQSDYWARARVPGGWRMELAGLHAPEDWTAYARALFGLAEAEAATVIDTKRGLARIAFHAEGRLLAALFAGPEPVAVARDHLASRLNEPETAALAGRPRADLPDPGATVCACLNVGINTIRAAIQSGHALTVAALGEALGAGTSCGSCRPELAGLLTRFKLPEAAE